MNRVGRTLLLVGLIVLALLAGLLIGRSQRTATPTEGNAQAVQITTTPPPAPPPPPLPASVPQAAPPPPKLALDQQVQEDAAAVGMTTRPDPAPPTEPETPAPKSGTADSGNAAAAPPPA